MTTMTIHLELQLCLILRRCGIWYKKKMLTNKMSILLCSERKLCTITEYFTSILELQATLLCSLCQPVFQLVSMLHTPNCL